MESMIRQDAHDEPDSDQTADLDEREAVEFAADFVLELSVPFTPEQVTAISEVAQARDISPSEAAQFLVAQALAAREAAQR